MQSFKAFRGPQHRHRCRSLPSSSHAQHQHPNRTSIPSANDSPLFLLASSANVRDGAIIHSPSLLLLLLLLVYITDVCTPLEEAYSKTSFFSPDLSVSRGSTLSPLWYNIDYRSFHTRHGSEFVKARPVKRRHRCTAEWTANIDWMELMSLIMWLRWATWCDFLKPVSSKRARWRLGGAVGA